MSKEEPSKTIESPTGSLTKRKKEVLEFLEQYITLHGYAPVMREIKEALGVTSRATVHEHLKGLERHGYISRESHKARSIKLLHPPEYYIIAARPTFAPDRVLEQTKKAISVVESLDEADQMVFLGEIKSSTRAGSICLHLADRPQDQLVPRLWLGQWQEAQVPRSFARGEGVAGYVWEAGEVYVSHGNVQDNPQYLRPQSPDSRNVQSLMVAPIPDLTGEIIGTLSLESFLEDRFSDYLKNGVEELTFGFTAELKTRGIERSLEGFSEESTKVFAVDIFLLGFRTAVGQLYGLPF